MRFRKVQSNFGKTFFSFFLKKEKKTPPKSRQFKEISISNSLNILAILRKLLKKSNKRNVLTFITLKDE